MHSDDYETLPTTSLAINMTAGALAGVLEHCLMYPLDSVKTRMQSLSPSVSRYNITDTFKNMIKKEGILRPVRGVTVVVVGAGPAHALYFGFYEFTKELLTKVTINNNVNYMISGAVATLIHDAVSNPTEVVKQRMQMYNSPYKSVIKCVQDIYRKEGIKAFYRSYATQLVMNLPYQTIHFATYEFFQNKLNNDRRYNAPVHMVAGGAAGAMAAAVTTPLDVIKTLLNTQETGFTKGMLEATREIVRMAGPQGFFKGLTARVLYSMPATAICWSTYEFFKFYLCGKSSSEYKSSITGKNMLKPRETASLLPTSIVADAVKLQTQVVSPTYMLPSTAAGATAVNNKIIHSTPISSSAITTQSTTTTTTTNTSATTTTSPASQPSTGPIKTVCELSTSVTSPAFNLHTRHEDVKSPFDQKFSST